MKNLLILGLMALMLALGSCQKAAETAENAAAKVADAAGEVASKAVDATGDAAKAVADKAGDVKDAALNAISVPSFEDPAIGAYLGEYGAFVTKYAGMMAEKTNVTEAQLTEMRDKAVEFGNKANDVVKGLKVDEMDKFNAYFSKIQESFKSATTVK